MEVVKRHDVKFRKGQISIEPKDRIFNPCRDTYRLFQQADRIGGATGKLARIIFADEGRPGQRRLQGLVGLARKFPAADIERASALVLSRGGRQGHFVKRVLKANAERLPIEAPSLAQSHELIRNPHDYGAFFSQHARESLEEQKG